MEINDTTKISSFYPKSEVKSVRKSAKTSDTSAAGTAAQESGISAMQKQDTFVRQETVSATRTAGVVPYGITCSPGWLTAGMIHPFCLPKTRYRRKTVSAGCARKGSFPCTSFSLTAHVHRRMRLSVPRTTFS